MNKIYILSLLFLILGCKNDDFQIKHRTITGNCNLVSVHKSGLVTDSYGTYTMNDEITSDCDILTTIEIKANGTFVQIEFKNDNYKNQIFRSGIWKVTGAFYGSFLGEVEFDNSSDLYVLNESNYINETILNLHLCIQQGMLRT
jgi:hypothetical protein